jgi:hypothetical protein
LEVVVKSNQKTGLLTNKIWLFDPASTSVSLTVPFEKKATALPNHFRLRKLGACGGVRIPFVYQ